MSRRSRRFLAPLLTVLAASCLSPPDDGALAIEPAVQGASMPQAIQAPMVTITSPANNATVAGVITVDATAADPDGDIVSVQFQLPDGTSTTDTTPPYSATWDSATVPDGSSYAIRAIATDNGTATTTATVGVTVANGGPSCVNGTFSATGLPLPVPDNTTVGVMSPLQVTGNGGVGSLALSASISHPYRGDLVVTLISPSGTQLVVSNRSGGSADNIVITNQLITNFNNQTAAGTWQLKVADLASIDTGAIDAWSLAIVGSCGATTHWRGSATPNLPTIDNGTACSSLTVAASGDAAAATLNVAGRHDWRSSLRATLAHNGVTVEAFPINTFPAGPGAFGFANRVVGGLSGDSSGMWTLCLVDTDAYGDTGLLSSWSVHD
jgi:subtilisin-like proprotein convertase family protein